jgi:osmotically-inducible protein OsmY
MRRDALSLFRRAGLAIALIAIAGVGVSGCADLAMTGGALLVFEDRSTSDEIADDKIGAGIVKRMTEMDKGLVLDIGVEAWEQRVLLTGALNNGGRRQAAAIGRTVNDVWIETKIKATLATTRGVTSVNFRWRSLLSTVYLIGRARGAWERDMVIASIRDTEGVKGVVMVRAQPKSP